MPESVISDLRVYPIKSCRPAEVNQYKLGPYGLQHDREWIIARPNGLVITQRSNPELATIETKLTDEALLVNSKKLGELAIDLHGQRGAEVEVNLFDKTGTATADSTDANKYFSEFLGRDVQFLRAMMPRTINPKYQDPAVSTVTNFADGFPLLLTSTASLDALNEHARVTIPMERFRANIVVSGSELEPFDEDYWRRFQAGNMCAKVLRNCARCPMPDVNQQTGILAPASERYVKQALQIIRQGYETGKDKKEVFFGQNISHELKPGTVLQKGDVLTVLERSDERNWQQPAA
jgi:uncharacterized protein YcbX